MATIKNNPLLKGISGKLGEYYFKIARGKTQIAKLPRTSGHRSPHQLKVQNKFREATTYAKAQMCDCDVKALYQTGVTDKKPSAYLVAVSDALNAPEIHKIDIARYKGDAGDVITIKATDDFKVVRVLVVITDGHGNDLECGDALRSVRKPDFWKYTAKEYNWHVAGTTVTVTAFDIPENETTSEVVLENH